MAGLAIVPPVSGTEPRPAPCQRWMTSRSCWRRRRHRAQMGLERLKEPPGAMKVKNFQSSQMQKHVAVINRHIVLSSKKKRVKRWLILSRHLDFPSMGHSRNDCSPIREVVLLAGWWFGTFGLFFHMLGIIIPTDFHMFQRGRSTTNQLALVESTVSMLSLEPVYVWCEAGHLLPGGFVCFCNHVWDCLNLPSGKRLHNYRKSPWSMGKITINDHFQ